MSSSPIRLITALPFASLLIAAPALAGPVPKCVVPNIANPAPAFAPGVFGGAIQGQQLTLPVGQVLELTSSLVVIANGKLTIDGTITYAAKSDRTIDITLISLNDDIDIGGQVGEELGFNLGDIHGEDVSRIGMKPEAEGGHGVNGGNILIHAPNGQVSITGGVVAATGGNGGQAKAIGLISPGGIFEEMAPDKTRVKAVGGNGSDGGHVKVCAFGNVFVGGTGRLYSGDGGVGGDANAYSFSGQIVAAYGGKGGKAGRVSIEGLDPAPQPSAASVQGRLAAGHGGNGGDAEGMVMVNVFGDGPDAIAEGGLGGDSETVEFINIVARNSSLIDSGMAGEGGNAKSLGGDGGISLNGNQPTQGGDGFSVGGDGGMLAPIPMIQGGTSNKRDPSKAGKGGDALATAGFGGPANGNPKGQTGTAGAQGGKGTGTSNGGSASKAGPEATGKSRPKAKSQGTETGI